MLGRGRLVCCALTLMAGLGAVGCAVEQGGSPPEARVDPPTPPPATPAPTDTPPPPAVEPPAPPVTPPAPVPPEPGPVTPPPAPGTPVPKPTVCAPTGAGPYWLQEGEPLSLTLRCGTGHTGPALRFTVSPLPAGASVDASGTFRWTPGKDQAAVWNLTVTETSTGETGTLKVGVAENWQAPGNVRIVDPAAYTEEYGLPVLHLNHVENFTAGGYRPAELIYRGRRYAMEAKYRGATSSQFPKRNYTLKFPEGEPFNEPFQAGGFMGRERLVLITTFNDNSYIRPRLAFDLWNRMSPDHIQIKTYSAVLYDNGRFWGLVTVADHVDEDLMVRQGLSKSADLFKAVEADANFSWLDSKGQPKTLPHQGFEKKEGKPKDGWPGAYDTLNALTAFIADSDAATFRSQRAARMNTRDYEDWWIFNTLILGTDSSAKNAYHYYDKVTQGPWRFIPWDLDASLGQEWDTRRISATMREDFAADNLLFSRMLADPSIAGPMRERYRELLRGPWKLEEVEKLLDGYVRELGPVAKRDEARWSKEYREFERWADRTDFTTHEQEVAYVRQWVRERWRMLEQRVP